MTIHNIFYNGIRTLSVLSILILLSIGFILPISFIQALVINPIILVFLMVIFSLSNEKLKPVKQLPNIIRLPDSSKCKQLDISKVA